MRKRFFYMALITMAFIIPEVRSQQADKLETIQQLKLYGVGNDDIILTPEEISNSSRRWWVVVLADAAGTLGGVASGMQICRHWLCSVFGGIIGGAGASVAVSRNISGEIFTVGKDVPVSFLNTNEAVGRKHNQVINDFYRVYQVFDYEKLYDFLMDNRQLYGFDEMPFSKEQYREVVLLSSREFESVNQAVDNLNDLLPHWIEYRKEFLTTVEKLLNLEGIAAFNLEVLPLEEEFYKMNKLSENEKLLYQSFFSTLRHSANFWTQ